MINEGLSGRVAHVAAAVMVDGRKVGEYDFTLDMPTPSRWSSSTPAPTRTRPETHWR